MKKLGGDMACIYVNSEAKATRTPLLYGCRGCVVGYVGYKGAILGLYGVTWNLHGPG